MDTVQIREAKATFSSLVAAAEQGRPTLITRHGQPSAMIVPVASGKRLYPLSTPSLAEYLLGLPQPLNTDRDPTTLRDIDL
jgi:antitoxin Phd